MRRLRAWWERWGEYSVQVSFTLWHGIAVAAVLMLLLTGAISVARPGAIIVLPPFGALSAAAFRHHARRVWRLLRGRPLGVAYLTATPPGAACPCCGRWP